MTGISVQKGSTVTSSTYFKTRVMNSGRQTVTSICPLTVVEASADGTGHSHSVATALTDLAVDRVTGGATVVRSTATGGVVAEAERVGGRITP